MKSSTLIAVSFILGIVLTLGLSEFYTGVIAPDLTQVSLDETYLRAIEDAMVAKESEIYDGLTLISGNNEDLIWRGESANESVLVVTWTKYTSSYPVNETVVTSWGETWVTIVPEIQNFFENQASTDINVTLRAAQLLGLPANSTNTYFVELWVNPQSLFRPTADNEINDTVATLNFPSDATAEYKEWFNSNILYSYYPMKYPWTRLGYTYDWGKTSPHVGLSEFVIKQNSTVIVNSVTPTQEYLRVADN